MWAGTSLLLPGPRGALGWRQTRHLGQTNHSSSLRHWVAPWISFVHCKVPCTGEPEVDWGGVTGETEEGQPLGAQKQEGFGNYRQGTWKSKGLEVGLDLKGEVASLILQEMMDPGPGERQEGLWERSGLWGRGGEKMGSKTTAPLGTVVPDWAGE